MYLSMSVIFWKGERERERGGREREGDMRSLPIVVGKE